MKRIVLCQKTKSVPQVAQFLRPLIIFIMSGIILRREAINPSHKNLQLIETMAEEIMPEEQEMRKWYQKYVATHKKRLAFDLGIVAESSLNQSHRILEFGSTPPIITASLCKLGYEVQGIDIAPERFSSTIKRLNLEVQKCDIENESLPFKDNSFDIVIFNEIFEHLRNLLYAMREVYRVTKPNGLLLISTPNVRSINGILNFLIQNKAYSSCGDIYNEYLKLENIGHMGHVREYTSSEVIDFLEQVGFESEKIIYRGTCKDSRLKRIAIKALPSLSPYMTIISKKLANE